MSNFFQSYPNQMMSVPKRKPIVPQYSSAYAPYSTPKPKTAPMSIPQTKAAPSSSIYSQAKSIPGQVSQADRTIAASRKPTPTPKPQPTMNDMLEASRQRYNTYLSDAQKKQQAFAEKAKNEAVNNTNTRFNNAASDLKVQIPEAEQAFGKFRDRVLTGVEDTAKQGEAQKLKAEEYTGEEQRTAAITRRDTMAQREQQYGALNTIDSMGVGSFQQANANDDTEFNRGTNKRYGELKTKKLEIDDAVSLARREAQAKIDDEDTKLQQTIRQIKIALRDNTQAQQEAIRQAELQAEEIIGGIVDEFEGLRMTAEQEKMRYDAETPQLSEQFLKTGVPTSAVEFEFMQKNKDAFANIGTGGKNAAKQEITSAISDLLGQDLSQIFGWGSVNPLNQLPASQAQNVKAKLERLKGLVSLENANKLKGQGQITESERTMLANAATILNNPRISPEQAVTELNRLAQQFGGSNQTMNEFVQAPNSGNDPLGIL